MQVISQNENGIVTIIDDSGTELHIPPDQGNRYWQMIQEWIAEGNQLPVYEAHTQVPRSISDRQFFQELALMGLITTDEALAAVTVGSIPAAMLEFIAALPAAQQFPARMVLCGATEFERSHPLVAAFGAAQGLSSQDIDNIWIAASNL